MNRTIFIALFAGLAIDLLAIPVGLSLAHRESIRPAPETVVDCPHLHAEPERTVPPVVEEPEVPVINVKEIVITAARPKPMFEYEAEGADNQQLAWGCTGWKDSQVGGKYKICGMR